MNIEKRDLLLAKLDFKVVQVVLVMVYVCILTGTDLLGLDGGVPNGDPGLLFSLLVSTKIIKHSFSDMRLCTLPALLQVILQSP